MATEEASKPGPREVPLSPEGREILGREAVRCSPLRTGGVIDICATLRREGVKLTEVFVPNGKKVPDPFGRKDDQGNVRMVEGSDIGPDIWAIPEVMLAGVAASTGLNRDQIRDLPPGDSTALLAKVIETTNLDSVVAAVKNLLTAGQGKWLAMKALLPSTGSRS